MKKTVGALCLFFLSQITLAQVNAKLKPYAGEVSYSSDNKISFIKISGTKEISESAVASFINSYVLTSGVNQVSLQKTERDDYGFTHSRFNIVQNGVVLANKIIIAHCSNGKLVSLNGDLSEAPAASNGFAITEKQALRAALIRVNAKKYKWENKEEEEHMRQALNDPNFSYAPVAEKMILEQNGKMYNSYRFNIYAEEPLYRSNVFVDASNGKVLDEQNLLCTSDVNATVVTKYSGTQPIVTDYTGTLYRLREAQRGLGIETYNMKNTSTYASNDFTNTTTSWTTTGFDQAAGDAHWGAEMTYDYYYTQHNRNSINNAGFKLISYVHYMTNYLNAFWDGQRMTYGDGNGTTYKIFTALDVCGHEITHGLTANTAALSYTNESGALNEAFSDMFGTSIENYGRPNNWNWSIGEDITGGGGLRSMSNPHLFSDPNTYGGNYYYTGTADYGGVHTNSSVGNYWYYLLASGGFGTNDLNHTYSVTGVGISNASKIAFRALTVYFTPTTNFATARLLTIQAAKDIFGSCSNEVIATTKAWYAVGVGADYVNGVVSDFGADGTNFCSVPATVNFTNMTANGFTYTWTLGDGGVSTTTNVAHTYTAVGVYTVKLKTIGCSNAADSITKTSYITVSPPVSAPVVSGGSGCENSTVTLTGSGTATLRWYNSQTGGLLLGTGNSFITPTLTTTTTFYAANTLTLAPSSGGFPSNTNGGYSNSNANFLIFDVLQPSVLNSVVVYAQNAGVRTIEMRSSTNAVLFSTTDSLAQGANTVILNYNMTPGTNYRLGLNISSISNLYKSSTGVSYPYNIGGCVNITSSNGGNSVYYSFYNWNVTKQECASQRVPVVATVNPGPVVSMSPPQNAICSNDVINLQGTPAGGIYSGQGMNGNLFSAAALGTGTYTVDYLYTDANGCSNYTDAALIVEDCTGIASISASNSNISIYPNPAKDHLVVNNAASGASVVIADASGRVVFAKNLNAGVETIQLDNISSGMYIVRIQDPKGATIKTAKLVKE